MIALPPRLRAIADLIPHGARVVDVGTDHARLPAFLVQRGLASLALATDVKVGPLARARRTVETCGLEDRVLLRMANGLSGLPLGNYDVVVVAGMGADTIVDILTQTPPPPGLLLLLQPMAHAERLRGFLARVGGEIVAERLAHEDRRLYNILAVRFDGVLRHLAPYECYVSAALAASGDPQLPAYLDRQIKRLQAEAEGLSASSKPDDAPRSIEVLSALDGLLRLRQELGNR